MPLHDGADLALGSRAALADDLLEFVDHDERVAVGFAGEMIDGVEHVGEERESFGGFILFPKRIPECGFRIPELSPSEESGRRPRERFETPAFLQRRLAGRVDAQSEFRGTERQRVPEAAG